jgi:prepilin-type N-terminal cleavage/methylation domain-containing protein
MPKNLFLLLRFRPRQSFSLSRKGFTLLEVLVSLVVLSSATAGLFASFVAAQKYVMRSRHRLQAANGARMVLEDLKAHVNQNNWDDSGTNLLACPGGPHPAGYFCENLPYPLPGAVPGGDYDPGPPWNWSAKYRIDYIGVGGIIMRQVTVTVHWDEPVS